MVDFELLYKVIIDTTKPYKLLHMTDLKHSKRIIDKQITNDYKNSLLVIQEHSESITESPV